MSSSGAIVIYTRYSTQMQSSHSCEDQERKVRQHLERLGFDTSQAIVLHERAQSGTKEDRPKYQELLALVRSGKVDVVAVDEQSRISRSDNAVDVIRDLIYEGARFISVDGVDTDNQNWKVLGQVKGIQNSSSIDETAARVKRGMEGRVLRNLSAGDFPFGYESFFVDEEYARQFSGHGPKPEKAIRICARDSAVVRQIFEEFVAGKSLSGIARQLEATGAPRGRRVKHWSAKLVRRLLENDKYGGQWSWGKTTFIRDSKGRKKQIPVAPGTVVTCERPDLAIIPTDLFERAKARLRELEEYYGYREGQARRGLSVHHTIPYPKQLLLHLLRCDACGAKMHQTKRRADAAPMRECCQLGVGCRVRTRVPADAAYRALTNFFADLLGAMPDWLKLVATKFHEQLHDSQSSAAAMIEQQKRTLQEIARKIESLYAMAEVGGADVPTIVSRINKLSAQQASAEAQLADARAMLNVETNVGNPQWLEEQLRDLASIIESDEQRATQLIAKFVDEVRVQQVRPPGRVAGGDHYLIFRLNGWRTIVAAMEGRLPPSILRFMASHEVAADDPSPEFCLPVVEPGKHAEFEPQILELRAAGTSWSAIARATGLSWYQVKMVWVRHQARQDLLSTAWSPVA